MVGQDMIVMTSAAVCCCVWGCVMIVPRAPAWYTCRLCAVCAVVFFYWCLMVCGVRDVDFVILFVCCVFCFSSCVFWLFLRLIRPVV